MATACRSHVTCYHIYSTAGACCIRARRRRMENGEEGCIYMGCALVLVDSFQGRNRGALLGGYSAPSALSARYRQRGLAITVRLLRSSGRWGLPLRPKALT